METLFKKGDKVFHICYGWGEVTKVNDAETYAVAVQFYKNDDCEDSEELFTIDGKEYTDDLTSILSFTEYTLQGFTQKKPIVLPEIGELCLVKDFKDKMWKARNFKKFTTHFLDEYGERWDYFKRIKILD